MVTDLDALGQFTLGNDDTGTFVAADQRHLDGKRPVAFHSVEIGMADAGVLDLHQNFIGARLGDGDLLVDGWTAFLFDDLRPLLLRNLRSHGGG